MGSKAPNTVVPAVAATKNGIFPLDLCSRTKRSNSDGIILPLKSLYMIGSLNSHRLFLKSYEIDM